MATVTRKPHDGRIILGGKGSFVTVRPETPITKPEVNSDNKRHMDALFANMAKVRQYPMAPDPLPPEDEPKKSK